MPRFELAFKSIELRLKQVFTISRGSKPTVNNVFVRLRAKGTDGYGEAAPNKRYNEDAETVETWLNALPDDFFEDIDTPEALYEKLETYSAATATDVKSARAALEMAWLDWWAKTQDRPLWQLWDAPSNAGPVTSFTIGLDTPEVMQQKVKDAAQYPILKVKLGTARDREIIQAIRAVSDKPLRVDANEGWKSLDQAKAAIDFLSDQNIEMVEQPMPADCFTDMTQLREFSPIPLCADESFVGEEDLNQIASAFDIINIKLMKTGSLIKSKAIIDQAKSKGLQVMIGCMIESSLANSAGALLSLWADYADLDGHLLISDDPFEGLRLDNDTSIQLGEGSGLGVHLRQKYFKLLY